MIRRAVAGVAALGLIGGVGHVAWHHDGATVKVEDANGVTHSTSISFDRSGATYKCPAREQARLSSMIEEAGRIKITLQGVNKYANPDRYAKLVVAYNDEIDSYNKALDRDCTSS